MRSRSAFLFALLPLLPGAAPTEATRTAIRVLDPSGKTPIAGAGVACLDPAGPGATVGADGRIPITATCRRVRCWAEGYLFGEAAVDGSSADCRVVGAARVEGTVLGLAKAEGVEARLYAHGEATAAAREALVPSDPPGGAPRLAIGPVPAGRYRLELVRASDGWTCRADLGPLGHGRVGVAAAWREPRVVSGFVVDGNGDAIVGIPVRAWSEWPDMTPVPMRVPGAPARSKFGLWSCSAASAAVKKSGSDGAFSFATDPGSPFLVGAGGFEEPHGVAAAAFDVPPESPVRLRPQVPARLVARVLDEEDRPAKCRSVLTVKDANATWLARHLPGSTLDAPCASDGSVRLGPFLPSEWELFVRPAAGLGIRERGDSPQEGTTEDLGILRVRRGASIRVVVLSKDGAPVEGAEVVASGSAGIVLTNEATTDANGEAEIPGFPERAQFRLQVRAEGFERAWVTGKSFDEQPIRIELARGAILEGDVRDRKGDPVAATLNGTDASGRTETYGFSDESGAFRLAHAPAGSLRLVAHAPGYDPSRPVEIETRPGERVQRIRIELAAAEGIRGRVLDARGGPVFGARVTAARDWELRDLDAITREVETRSGSSGEFTLPLDPYPGIVLVATAKGHGTGIDRTPMASQGRELVLTLPQAARLEAQFEGEVPPTRRVHVVDGAGVGRSALARGLRSLSFDDLAPGPGRASLVPGETQEIRFEPGRTSVVTLREGPTVEGTVRQAGTPVAHAAVVALAIRPEGVGQAGTAETDRAGEWKLENLAPGSYRFVAFAPEGRAERSITVRGGGTVRVDLEMESAFAEIVVTDAREANPVGGAEVRLDLEGAVCRALLGSTSWGNVFQAGLDINVSDGACYFGTTSANGRLRLALPRTGTHDLSVRARGYEPASSRVEIVSGENTIPIALSPTGGPSVRVRLVTDPPGLPGTLQCIRGAGEETYSFGGARGMAEWPHPSPGPAEAIFRVDGYGVGRAAFEIPEEGEIEVTVEVRRAGQLRVAAGTGSSRPPLVRGADGIDWTGVLLRARGGAIERLETPDLGVVWLLRYLPPGVYSVERDGVGLGSFSIEAGELTSIR